MKTKLYTILAFLIIVSVNSCELQREDFERITPENFYNNANDAEMAIVAIYDGSLPNIFWTNHMGMMAISDLTTPEAMGIPGQAGWERHNNHEWTPDLGWNSGTQLFGYYNKISEARKIAKNIDAIDIPDAVKLPLIAEANALAGWLSFILYDLYGPVPYPTDEQLTNPQVLEYPSRPTNEQFVAIIEELFSMKEYLSDPSFNAYRGRMNKGIANFVLIKLYMLEAGRTGNSEYFNMAKVLTEETIGEDWYQLEEDILDIFSVNNKGNREVVYAVNLNNDVGGNPWHAATLPNNYPFNINDDAGAFGMFRLTWNFFDTFDENDLRLGGIIWEYTNYKGEVVSRENPVQARHGLQYGPFFGLKYDMDPNLLGRRTNHDIIVYRYADLLLTLAECLNELETNSSLNAPVVTQTAMDGSVLQSDGGNTPYSFINAIRTRAGLPSLIQGLSKSALRDSIFIERGFEFYGEGLRRQDYIRYQRITNSQGIAIYDPDPNKFYFPIASRFIDEFKGQLIQNEGYE